MRLRGINIRQTVLMIALKQEGSDVTASDFAIVQRKFRVNYVATDHSVRFGKIMLVVTVRAAECDHGRNGVAAAASAA